MTWARKLFDPPACYKNVTFGAAYFVLPHSMWQLEKIKPLTMGTYYSPAIIQLCVLFFLIDSEHWSIITLKVSLQNVAWKKWVRKSSQCFDRWFMALDLLMRSQYSWASTEEVTGTLQTCILVAWQIEKAFFLPEWLSKVAFFLFYIQIPPSN